MSQRNVKLAGAFTDRVRDTVSGKPYLRGCLREPLEQRPDLGQIGPRRRSQRHAPVMALEQCRAEPFLEQTHMLTDRAVSHVQFGGGFLDAAEPAGGLEGAQRIQRGQGPFHSEEFI